MRCLLQRESRGRNSVVGTPHAVGDGGEGALSALPVPKVRGSMESQRTSILTHKQPPSSLVALFPQTAAYLTNGEEARGMSTCPTRVAESRHPRPRTPDRRKPARRRQRSPVPPVPNGAPLTAYALKPNYSGPHSSPRHAAQHQPHPRGRGAGDWRCPRRPGVPAVVRAVSGGAGLRAGVARLRRAP